MGGNAKILPSFIFPRSSSETRRTFIARGIRREEDTPVICLPRGTRGIDQPRPPRSSRISDPKTRGFMNAFVRLSEFLRSRLSLDKRVAEKLETLSATRIHGRYSRAPRKRESIREETRRVWIFRREFSSQTQRFVILPRLDLH